MLLIAPHGETQSLKERKTLIESNESIGYVFFDSFEPKEYT